MDNPDQLRELFRMQKALNERIGVHTDSMSDEQKQSGHSTIAEPWGRKLPS